MEELGRARLKNPESMHLIVVPHMKVGRWQKHLTRGTTSYLCVNSDQVWPLKEHLEPLLIFVLKPYSSTLTRLAEKGVLLEELGGTLLWDEVPKVPEVQG
jgi:hypothetical protein